MKKATLLIALFAVATIAGAVAPAGAATCTDTNNLPSSRSATDPFGSCEDWKAGANGGNVKCGTGENVGGVFTLIVLNTANKGVQGCSGRTDLLPIGGRVGVLVEGDNDVSVHADGSDSENSGGASAWQRYDVRPNERAVCARRGTSGTWYTNTNNGKGTSTADTFNQGIDATGNRAPCGGAVWPV